MKKIARKKTRRKPRKSSSQFTISSQDANRPRSEDAQFVRLHFPVKSRGGRPRTSKTDELIEKIRKLKSRNQSLWTVAREFWPDLPVETARARLRVFLSKHKREI